MAKTELGSKFLGNETKLGCQSMQLPCFQMMRSISCWRKNKAWFVDHICELEGEESLQQEHARCSKIFYVLHRCDKKVEHLTHIILLDMTTFVLSYLFCIMGETLERRDVFLILNNS